MRVLYGKSTRAFDFSKTNQKGRYFLKLKVNQKHPFVNFMYNSQPLLLANAAFSLNVTRKVRKRATDLVRRNRRCIRPAVRHLAPRGIINLTLVLKSAAK